MEAKKIIMAELWEKNGVYSFFRHYVDWCTRQTYSSLRVEGSLPDDGRALLIAPNHCNTLMDALVVLQSIPGPSVYGARADIFRKPKVAAILHFLRIVPIARARDGLRSVAQNLEIMPKILDVLHHNVPFCLFPEGRHRTMYSLLPIHKGMVRIAVKNAATQPTWLVPAGLDYSDFFHIRTRCTLRYGEPIDVNRFIKEHEGMHNNDMYAAMAAELTKRISGLIRYIPDDEHYQERLDELYPVKPRRWWQIPLAVLTLPFFIASAVLALPLWAGAELLCRLKLKDKAFCNTARYAFYLVGMPLFLIVLAVPAFILLPWWAAVLLLAYYVFSYWIFYSWLGLLRRSER